MGNIFSKKGKKNKSASSLKVKIDKPKHVRGTDFNRADYISSNLTDQTIMKNNGELNGESYTIENCKNCVFIILDISAAITIDECENCEFIFGPCESSVFLRDCIDCKFAIVTKQLRTRDCKNCDIFLFSQTEPVIESSTDMRIGCYDVTYFSLEKQLQDSEINVWNNRFSDIYDFTPSQSDGQKNYSLIDYKIKYSDIFKENTSNIDFTDVIIPKTVGSSFFMDYSNNNKNLERVFLCFMPQVTSSVALDTVKIILQGLKDDNDEKDTEDNNISFISQTRSFQMNKDQCKILFKKPNQKLVKKAMKGEVIGIEFLLPTINNGDNDNNVVTSFEEKLYLLEKEDYHLSKCEQAKIDSKFFFKSWRPKM